MKTPRPRTVIALATGLAVTAGGVLAAGACLNHHHSGNRTIVEFAGASPSRPGRSRAAAAPGYVFIIEESGGSASAPVSGSGGNVSVSPAGSAKTEAAPVVSWAVSDGGNGHTYQAVCAPDGISWADAQAWAVAQGGYLATLTSAAENSFVFALVDDPKFWWNNHGNSSGPWLGGYQPAGSPEPDGGWQWVHGEGAFTSANWAVNEPDDAGPGQNCLNFYAWGTDRRQPTLDDEDGTLLLHGFVVEYDSLTVTVGTLAGAGLAHAGPAAGVKTRASGAPVAESATTSPASAAVPAVTVGPVAVTGELKIFSAVFGGRGGEADLTALVAEKVRPGADVFFASPKWLGIDPAPYWKKSLVITYEFRGRAATYTAREGGAVAYELLVANAGGAPSNPPAASSAAGGEPRIIAAYFGTGGQFADVTARVAGLIGASSGAFPTTPERLGVDPTVGLRKEFMVIYEIGGQRRTFTTPEGGPCGRDLLMSGPASAPLAGL